MWLMHVIWREESILPIPEPNILLTIILTGGTCASIPFSVAHWFASQAEKLETQFREKIYEIRARKRTEVEVALTNLFQRYQSIQQKEIESPKLPETIGGWFPSFAELAQALQKYYYWGRCLDDTQDKLQQTSHCLVGLTICSALLTGFFGILTLLLNEILGISLYTLFIIGLAIILVLSGILAFYGLLLLRQKNKWSREYSQVDVLFPVSWKERLQQK